MNRGDVVEIRWFNSDRSEGKVRPALVVQADFLNSLIDDTILVQITGSRFGIPGTEVMIDPAIETASGLTKVSVANCTQIVTIDQGLALPIVGYLSNSIMLQIEACLKKVLEIP